jgi:tripartite ATP-independent transporter DctM subunit
LLLIIIVIGGILAGVFTATEASAIAVAYALLLSMVFYKSIKFKDLKKLLLETAKTTSIVVFMIGVSSVMSFVMAFANIPALIASGLLGVTSSPIVILLIMNIVLLVVGCFMDPTPAVLIFTPIFLPIVQSFGMSPIQFGIIMVFNLCIGTITPPVGPILFVGCKVAGIRIEDVFKRLLPFFVAEIAVLMLVTYIPAVSMIIPQLAGLVK